MNFSRGIFKTVAGVLIPISAASLTLLAERSYADEEVEKDASPPLPKCPRAANSNPTWPCPSSQNGWERPTVHLLSGMISSGKSTLSRKIAKEENATVFSPDEVMLHLYGRDFDVSQFQTVGDQVKEVIWHNAQEILVRHNGNVVLDFSLWYADDREFWRRRIEQDSMSWFSHCEKKPWEYIDNSSTSTSHIGTIPADDKNMSVESQNSINNLTAETPAVKVKLHYIRCPTEVCRNRLIERNSNVLLAREHELAAVSSKHSTLAPCQFQQRYPDAMNFVIDTQVFDRWCNEMQEPLSVENHIHHNCVPFDTTLETKQS